MSDPFDPDAWPRSSSSSGSGSSRNDEDNDDFNPFAGSQQDDYDQNTFGGPQGGYDNSGGASGDDYDYGQGANYGYDDDDDDYSTTGGATAAAQGNDWGAPAGRQQAARGQVDNDYRNEFDDDYDDYDNFGGGQQNDYDDFDAFDNEPNGGGGNGKRFLVIGAAVVVVALLIAGVATMIGGGKKDNQATPKVTTTAPADETTETTAAPDNAGDGDTETTDTTAATTDTTGAGAAGTPADAPDDVITTLNAALTAWGKFAVDGNLSDVQTYFQQGTKQYDRLTLDAKDISAKPPGGDPISVKMENPTTFKTDDNNWTIRGTAIWSRTGEVTQNYQYEIRMTRASDRLPWRISSVRQF